MQQDHEQEVADFTESIRRKYGDIAIVDLTLFWTPTKEKEYKSFIKKEFFDEQERYKRKCLITNRFGYCEVCKNIANKSEDQGVMTKYNACYSCYIQYITDGREKRWLSGWRPKQNNG